MCLEPALTLSCASVALAKEQPSLRVQNLMTKQEFTRLGLTKLTDAELDSPNHWLTRFAMQLVQASKQEGVEGGMYGGKPVYRVEASINDGKFLINGELYEAKTYCFSIEKGDAIIFLEGSAFGAYVSAKILHTKSGKICEVWCE